MTPPEKCQNCSFSTKYCRQKPGEIPLYVECCNGWLCEGCREHRECDPPSEPPAEAHARMDLQRAVPPNDGFYSRVPDQVYHSDPNSLSSSGARLLMPPSCPALFWANQQEPLNPKPQYDFGHAAHKMVLGEGSQLTRVNFDNWRTGEAQKQRNHAWLHGKAPLLARDIETAMVMAGRVHAHPIAGRLLQRGTAEMSGYWHDDDTGIRLRLRTDWLTDPGSAGGRIIAVDYKTSTSANPAAFAKAAADYGYHCQQAFYEDGLREVGVGDVGFVFIVQQKTPPYLVSVVQLDPEAVALGRRLNRRAIETFARCRENNVWPGYSDGIETVSLPGWLVKQTEALLDA